MDKQLVIWEFLIDCNFLSAQSQNIKTLNNIYKWNLL